MRAQLLLDAMGMLVAFVTVLLATPFVRRLASHVGMLDELGERRMHDVPKPRIGGVAVYLGFAFALFAVSGVELNLNLMGGIETHQLLGILFGGTMIFCVGVWDDVMTMRARNKLFAQILVAMIAMLYGLRIDGIPDFFHRGNWIDFPTWLEYPITLFWYLAMMNAINFIDGLDGLLSGYTAISGLSLLLIALTRHHSVVALVLAALVGATAGFLPYNFNPAKIILGDSGALFIGFVLAAASVIGESKQAIGISLVLPIVVLALPIIDTAVTIVRRTLAGRKISDADRGHFHHQLIFRFGLNVRQAVLLIYAVSFVLGIAALWLSGVFGGPLATSHLL